MINQLHSFFYRIDSGWDPVPSQHVDWYFNYQWERGVDQNVINRLESTLGGFAGKSVLDLGAGPGIYSIAFAQLGANVTWCDVSVGYKLLAEKKAINSGCDINFVVSYMDDAVRVLGRQYDLVFSRVCWHYCKSDRVFARDFYDLVSPGGFGYIHTHNHNFDEGKGLVRVLQKGVYYIIGVKIGHPYPKRGRVMELFLNKNNSITMSADYNSLCDDVVLFKRPRV